MLEFSVRKDEQAVQGEMSGVLEVHTLDLLFRLFFTYKLRFMTPHYMTPHKCLTITYGLNQPFTRYKPTFSELPSPFQ